MIDNDVSPCMFLKYSGYYCPGCGGTHSVIALLSGHPVISAMLNPFPVYAVLMLIALVIHAIIALVKKRHFVYPDGWIWGLLAIVVLNFVIRNIVLFLGFDIIQYAEGLMYM